MNCFEWQNHSSDFLDGTLVDTIKKEADQHLEECKDCAERNKHYRVILTSISAQPRSALPVPIRKSPLTAAVPKLDMAQLGKSRWDALPWYVRTTIEATSIVLLILGGISAGPKIRSFYERSVERSLRDFTESMNSGDTQTNVPLVRGKAITQEETRADEFDGEAEGEESDNSSVDEEQGEDEIRVGNSEIWRFNLKTDSPHELRARVVQTLTEMKIPANTPGVGGIEAPGGIQFDLLLPKSVVPGLKKLLQKIAPKPPEEQADTPAGETFTWYKNKSRRPIAVGKTRVVIWLSQM